MEFTTDILSVYDKKWALLTAGNEGSFNTMTISWGGLGTIWGRPVATVYVRTSRYTHEFMDNNERVLSAKEKFFVDKLKKEIDLAIMFIKDHLANTDLSKMLFENKIEVEREGDISVTFKVS